MAVGFESVCALDVVFTAPAQLLALACCPALTSFLTCLFVSLGDLFPELVEGHVRRRSSRAWFLTDPVWLLIVFGHGALLRPPYGRPGHRKNAEADTQAVEAAFDSTRPLRSGRSSRAASGAEGGVMACYSVDQKGGPANHAGRKTFREDGLYGERLASTRLLERRGEIVELEEPSIPFDVPILIVRQLAFGADAMDCVKCLVDLGVVRLMRMSVDPVAHMIGQAETASTHPSSARIWIVVRMRKPSFVRDLVSARTVTPASPRLVTSFARHAGTETTAVLAGRGLCRYR
jgi:hypothetical protein